MKKPRRTFGLNPVERAMLVASWKEDAVTGRIHALIGNDSDRLVNGAGRIFYVMLGACAAHNGCIDAEELDVRILRGAVNALHEQAEEPEIVETRRTAILSGLQACERLMPRVTQRALADAALDLELRMQRGDVRHTDFLRLVEQLEA
jgi:hypothetical protein